MNDSADRSHPAGHVPGWLSRRPVMTALAARLRGLEGARLFTGLRSLARPILRFASALAARFAAPAGLRPLWRTQLQLTRQERAGIAHPHRRLPSQPIFRRLVDRLGPAGRLQRAFQPLSVPHALLDALQPELAFSPAPDTQPSSLDTFPDEAPFTASSEPPLAGPENPRTQSENAGEAPPALAHQTANAHRPANRPSQRPTSMPAWPFQLVQPPQARPGQRTLNNPAGPMVRPNTTPAPGPSGPAARAASLMAPSAAHSPVVRPAPRQPAAAAALLQARPMTIQTADNPLPLVQAHIPITTVVLNWPQETRPSAALAASAPAPFISRLHRPVTSQAPAPSAPVPARSASAPEVQAAFQPAPPSTANASVEHLGLDTEPALNSPASSIDASPPNLPAAAGELPLFGVLRQLTVQPRQPGESSAVQHLRRMWPSAQIAPAARQVAAEARSLGPGEPLSPQLRRAVQPLLGGDMGEVRLHSSPIAQMLRAEAFTSGRHVVFAPGRFNPATPAGLALLGHELTHLGQLLAFKTESSAGPTAEDSHEQAANRQEEKIRAVIEQGWPQPPQREYRRPAQAVSPAGLGRAPVGAAVQRAVQIDEVTSSVEQPAPQQEGGQASPGAGPQTPQAGGAAGQPFQRAGAQAQSSPAAAGQVGAGSAGTVEALARQVYSIIKDRLRAERERHDLYGR